MNRGVNDYRVPPPFDELPLWKPREEAERRKEEGMTRVMDRTRESWKAQARAFVKELLYERLYVTGDDIRDAVPTSPHHTNVWGPFVLDLVKRGWLVNTGVMVISRRAQGNGNRIFRYRSRLYGQKEAA